jgi:ferrous iron transport protein B
VSYPEGSVVLFAIRSNQVALPIGTPTTGADVMFELDSLSAMETLLRAGGWTLLTAVNLMLSSLLNNPCSTTICASC